DRVVRIGGEDRRGSHRDGGDREGEGESEALRVHDVLLVVGCRRRVRRRVGQRRVIQRRVIQRRVIQRRVIQRRVITTCRYSPGTTIVPSSARLKRSTSASSSCCSS